MDVAALVFDEGNGALQNGSDLPPYISYKIRMDIDRVDSTYKYKVTDRWIFFQFCLCILKIN